jgi:K+-sensing histidine kinase KdpD
MGQGGQPDLAHRLRTPLAVIVGYIEILALRDRAGEDADVIEHLREASTELSAVIDEVVAARPSARRGGVRARKAGPGGMGIEADDA